MVILLRLILIAILFFIGCVHHTYHYDFSLVSPYDKGLRHDDGDVSFQFVPTAESIRVSIHNKTDSAISIIMNEAEFIDVWGSTHHLLFGESYARAMQGFINNNYFSRPITIDPEAKAEGKIWINVWSGSDIGDGWSTVTATEIDYLDHAMLPKRAQVKKDTELIDSLFYLLLPVHFDGYMRSYDFTFMIEDVEVVDSK